MPLDWNSGGLAEGLHCYESGEYFEAHEHWEGVWLNCDEPEKTFLQALIQITAAFHHYQRKNFRGTASLLRAALRKLEAFPSDYGGIDVEGVRASVRECLRALDSGEQLMEMRVPRIR
jgi:predicted metal-dependent hydrolase